MLLRYKINPNCGTHTPNAWLCLAGPADGCWTQAQHFCANGSNIETSAAAAVVQHAVQEQLVDLPWYHAINAN